MIDPALELGRIQAPIELIERFDLLPSKLRRLPEDSIGGPGLRITPEDLSVDAFFALKSHDWLEEVFIEPQLVAVKVVDQVQLLGCIITQVAQRPTDMGKVFLLDISVVVLAIGAAAGKRQVFLLGIPVELVVDEGVVVIAVDPPPGKGVLVRMFLRA